MLDPTPAVPRFDESCPSTVTLKINSTDYAGVFSVELRKGSRPGSARVDGASAFNGGAVTFKGLCAGQYFFAFGPPTSEEVSVTRYFPVENDGAQYSNPIITVYYSKITDPGQKVQKATKSAL